MTVDRAYLVRRWERARAEHNRRPSRETVRVLKAAFVALKNKEPVENRLSD